MTTIQILTLTINIVCFLLCGYSLGRMSWIKRTIRIQRETITELQEENMRLRNHEKHLKHRILMLEQQIFDQLKDYLK